ncbi:hypothetical protein O6H91_12G019200 [Diphasiastrum complanatum]|uniref:Uncharacterized protein n=1 Tax=Diphasiastrum complanatum TaxID=34168 RepID=A0ACC2BZF5_DIPCM|nr:hypothetical protein O6H91_12G019200 [Diphasiastrum complanatum]
MIECAVKDEQESADISNSFYVPDQSLSDCNDNKCLALLPLREGRDGETRIKVEEEHKDEAESEATLQKQVMLSLAPQYQHLHREQQGVIAGWEGFIPQQHLRVLLVESDDSTRHVVCALLRNCGYEVASASSEMQAWAFLENSKPHYDLVLADIMMPSLSGITLLKKIRNLDACKQVPVIMMSSLDSMDIVYKCLSKGAADFLVKPVRKNELKNLWQHVWRKCHNSGGSSSGSESQTGRFTALNSRSVFGQNSGSEKNGISALNIGGGSDNGSGNQTCWNKKATEVQSPARPSEQDPTCLPHRSIKQIELAQADTAVAVLKGESSYIPVYKQEDEAISQENPLDGDWGRSLQKDKKVFSASVCEPVEEPEELRGASKHSVVIFMQHCNQDDAVTHDINNEETGAPPVSTSISIDLLGNMYSIERGKGEECSGAASRFDGQGNISPTMKDKFPFPNLQLRLKSFQEKDYEDGQAEGRQTLRHSVLSAFSKYESRGAAQQKKRQQAVSDPVTLPLHSIHSIHVGHSGVDSHGVLPTGSLCLPVTSDQLCGHASTVADGQDLAAGNSSATNKSFHAVLERQDAKSGFFKPGMNISSFPPYDVLPDGLSGSYFPHRPPIFYCHSSPPPRIVPSGPQPDKEEEHNEDFTPEHATTLHSCPHGHVQPYQHIHQYRYRVEHHQRNHSHDISRTPELSDEQTVTNLAPGAPQYGLFNMPKIAEHDDKVGSSGSSNGSGVAAVVNASLNFSISCSNNLSSLQDGSSNGQSSIAAGGGFSDNGKTNGNSNGMSSGGGGRGVAAHPEESRLARREAALDKFRQKRKERCFEKKASVMLKMYWWTTTY